MSRLSDESIIAIFTLVVTCPPSFVLLWHLLRRKRLNAQREVQGLFEACLSMTHIFH
jgi:hypothetical protein